MDVTRLEIVGIAKSIGVEYAALMAFITVESGGKGFINGKLVIQFEPAWFRKKAPFAPSGLWSINRVDIQSKEWEAFNDAFRKDPNAAMESTSIGLGQVMGFHYKRLGFKTVGEMWDFGKVSEYNQVILMARFISTSPDLLKALKAKNWHLVALYYNGGGYVDLATKYGREPYNISLEKAFNKYAV